MPKTIKILLPNLQTTAVARLHEDLAPKTCQAVWDVLPFEGQAIHAKWGGNEIWTSMPSINMSKLENETIFPSPGDILIVQPAPQTYDFAIFYGKSWCFGPSGFVPGNHFATIVENLPELVKACERILKEGGQKIVVQRGESAT